MKRIRTLVLVTALFAVLGLTGLQSAASEQTVDIRMAAAKGNLETVKQQLELDKIKSARPKIVALLTAQGGKPEVKSTGFRGSYYVNGEIHVNTYGTPGGEPRFERIDCELATKGLLDRVSVSPSEDKVCFEYQTGFKYKPTGRTLYIADFDPQKRTITNAKPFANEEANPNRWFAYPRWTKDETAIVYHASPALYLYTLEDGTTAKVSTNDDADYRYPHCEATPK